MFVCVCLYIYVYIKPHRDSDSPEKSNILTAFPYLPTFVRLSFLYLLLLFSSHLLKIVLIFYSLLLWNWCFFNFNFNFYEFSTIYFWMVFLRLSFIIGPWLCISMWRYAQCEAYHYCLFFNGLDYSLGCKVFD